MGADPYWYFVKYEADVGNALNELREREFNAGRYNPVMPFIDFPITAASPTPGPQHDSIEEAFADAGADGTRSILDIFSVGDEPDFVTAAPLEDDVLEDLYGTTRPTRKMVETNMDFLDEIERGHCIYLVIYKDNKPDELFFAGYSFD